MIPLAGFTRGDLLAHTAPWLEHQQRKPRESSFTLHQRAQHRIVNRVFLIRGKHGEGDRDAHAIAVSVAAHSAHRAGEAHRLVPGFEIEQQVNEMTGTQIAFAGNHCTTGRDVLEPVVTDVIAALEELGATIDVDPVVRSSIPICPSMPHDSFRVPSRETKS